MVIRLIGSDKDTLLRMQKRLHCAAAAAEIPITISVEADDLRAVDLGARHGPIAIRSFDDGTHDTLMDGLEPVEKVQQRMIETIANRHGRR